MSFLIKYFGMCYVFYTCVILVHMKSDVILTDTDVCESETGCHSSEVIPTHNQYEYGQLINLGSGTLLKEANVQLLEWIKKHPSATIWVKQVQPFSENQQVSFAEYVYLEAGEVYQRQFKAASGFFSEGKIIASIVYNTQSSEDVSTKVETIGMGTPKLNLKIIANKHVQLLILIFSDVNEAPINLKQLSFILVIIYLVIVNLGGGRICSLSNQVRLEDNRVNQHYKQNLVNEQPPKGVTQISPAEVSPAQGSPTQISPAEVSPAHVSPAQGNPTHVGPAQVSPTQD